jgi:hypothetical protein
MKNLFVKVNIIIISFLLISCNCDPDVLLGDVTLMDTTKNKFPYSGNETLVFVNQNEQEIKYFGKNSKEIKPIRLVAAVTCSEGKFDNTEEFFNSEIETVTFSDQDGNQKFYTELSVRSDNNIFAGTNTVFYDYLSIATSYAEDFNVGDISLIVDDRGNQINTEEQSLGLSRYIGDTVLFERPFKEVYESSNQSQSPTFFNYAQGIVAYQPTDSTYLVLDRIE